MKSLMRAFSPQLQSTLGSGSLDAGACACGRMHPKVPGNKTIVDNVTLAVVREAHKGAAVQMTERELSWRTLGMIWPFDRASETS